MCFGIFGVNLRKLQLWIAPFCSCENRYSLKYWNAFAYFPGLAKGNYASKKTDFQAQVMQSVRSRGLVN